jgi:hypothetical protein
MSRSISINDFVRELAVKSATTIKGAVKVDEVPASSVADTSAAQSVIAPEPLPSEVLDHMANAMLDPELGRRATPLGNEIRKAVLVRALAAAEKDGWRLTRVS